MNIVGRHCFLDHEFFWEKFYLNVVRNIKFCFLYSIQQDLFPQRAVSVNLYENISDSAFSGWPDQMENSHKSFYFNTWKINIQIIKKSQSISTNNNRKSHTISWFFNKKKTDFLKCKTPELTPAYHRISCSSGEHNTMFFISIFIKTGRIEKDLFMEFSTEGNFSTQFSPLSDDKKCKMCE